MLIDKLGICNMALANLGQPPIQALNQKGASAVACNLRYDEARLEALAGAPWGFATSWKAGVLLAVEAKPGFSYAYAYPAGALQVFYIDHPKGTNAPAFAVTERPGAGGKMISTDEAAPIFVFTIDKEDVTTFDQQFIQAHSWLLSSKIAMPITKSVKLQQQAWQMWVGLRDVAEARTKNEGSQEDDRLGFYHEARD